MGSMVLATLRLEAVREDRAAKKAKATKEKEDLEFYFELCLASRDEDGNCACGDDCKYLKMMSRSNSAHPS